MKFKATVTITCEIEDTSKANALALIRSFYPQETTGARAIEIPGSIGYNVKSYSILMKSPLKRDIKIRQIRP